MARTNKSTVTREALLDQGVAFLTEHGYHGSGLQDILAAVKVPKGSFYHYFGSKEEFGAAAVAHYIEPFIRQLENALAEPGIRAFEALDRYYRGLTEELRQRDFRGGCLLGNLLGEIGDTSETCRNALRQALHRYRDKQRELVAKAQLEGTIRADLPAELLADLLVDGWQGALLRMKVERSARPLEMFREHLLHGYFRPST